MFCNLWYRLTYIPCHELSYEQVLGYYEIIWCHVRTFKYYIHVLLWIYCVIDYPWLLASVYNKSYIYKTKFYTIQFNIRINLYWAKATLYTCIVLSDIRSNWLNRKLHIVYKIHELQNDQPVERHKTESQLGFSGSAL